MHSLTSGVLEGGKTPPKEVPTPLVCPSPDPAEVLESAKRINNGYVRSLSRSCSSIIQVDATEPGDPDQDDVAPSHMVVLRGNVKNLSANDLALSENVAEALGIICPCGKDCLSHMTRAQVTAARIATADAMQGRYLTQHARTVLEQNRVTSKKYSNTKRPTWIYAEKMFCIEAFRIVHGFSIGAVRNGLTWVQADEGGRASIDKPRDKRKCEKTVEITEVDKFLGGSEQSITTMQWIAEYTTLHGCKMPTCDDVYIDDISWDTIHAEYKEDCETMIIPLKMSQFRNIWEEEFSHVKKRRRKPFGECTECAGFKTQLKELRNDPQTRDSVKQKYKSHLEHQKLERTSYYGRRWKGKRGAAHSIIMDGMDQSKTDLPHTETALKADGNMVETKITGILVHGRKFDCYVSEPQVKHDTNLALTCLHSTLSELWDEDGDNGPEVLYLQVDGGSENKNQWMLAYLATLVNLGIYKKIKMCFLPVGHTHEDIDQAFSRISMHFRRVSAFTFPDLLTQVRNSFKSSLMVPNVVQIGQTFDFKDHLDTSAVSRVTSWTDNHCYRFSWNPHYEQAQMHYKKWCNSEGYFGKCETCYVKSFKQVEALALLQEQTWAEHAGVLLGAEMPDASTPKYCLNIDFNKPKETKDFDIRRPTAISGGPASMVSRCSIPHEHHGVDLTCLPTGLVNRSASSFLIV